MVSPTSGWQQAGLVVGGRGPLGALLLAALPGDSGELSGGGVQSWCGRGSSEPQAEVGDPGRGLSHPLGRSLSITSTPQTPGLGLTSPTGSLPHGRPLLPNLASLPSPGPMPTTSGLRSVITSRKKSPPPPCPVGLSLPASPHHTRSHATGLSVPVSPSAPAARWPLCHCALASPLPRLGGRAGRRLRACWPAAVLRDGD